jgi:hypothetical protein
MSSIMPIILPRLLQTNPQMVHQYFEWQIKSINELAYFDLLLDFEAKNKVLNMSLPLSKTIFTALIERVS